MTLAETIDAAGIIPFAHANQEWRPPTSGSSASSSTTAPGPQKVYDALTGAAQWTDPAFVEALTMLEPDAAERLVHGRARPLLHHPLRRCATPLFADGEAAMKIEGTWWVADARTFFGEEAGNENDWDWVPVPSATGEAIFDLGIGSTYSINAKTRAPGGGRRVPHLLLLARDAGRRWRSSAALPRPRSTSRRRA